MSTQVQVLQELAIFRSVSVEDLQTLVTHAEEKIFMPGGVIIEEGSEGHEFFIVIFGEVNIDKKIGDQQTTVGVRRPGEIFGEMALLDKEPRSASAVAKSVCHVLCFKRDRFAHLMRSYPSFFISMLKLLNQRLRETSTSYGQLLENKNRQLETLRQFYTTKNRELADAVKKLTWLEEEQTDFLNKTADFTA